MQRRVIAAVSAALLALVGGLLIISYVRGADQRALAGQEAVDVLVVSEDIPKGAPADEISASVSAVQLPAVSVPENAVTSLEEVSGLVVTADLYPGEQLLATRFAQPASLATSEVDVPPGLQQLSIQLEPQRVIGGHLDAGDKVGIFVSMPGEAEVPAQTRLILSHVLVTRVQGGIATSTEADEPAADPVSAQGTPDQVVIVTLATTAPDAERIVFGQVSGSIWLSVQPDDATADGSRIVTRENIFE